MMTPIIFYINYKSIILIYIRKMSAIGWKEMRLGEGVVVKGWLIAWKCQVLLRLNSDYFELKINKIGKI